MLRNGCKRVVCVCVFDGLQFQLSASLDIVISVVSGVRDGKRRPSSGRGTTFGRVTMLLFNVIIHPSEADDTTIVVRV